MQHDEDLAKKFQALGDRTRFRLYQRLGEKAEICVSQLAEELAITPACVSQHMKILSDAGLVTRIRTGQRVCYEVATDTARVQKLRALLETE
jgi:ArsR family transcriptional regulator